MAESWELKANARLPGCQGRAALGASPEMRSEVEVQARQM